MDGRTYIAIDLKSFYASVECVERGLDPLTTNLVVADESRTEKTIYLAVSPSLKAYGVPGRPRLFEVVQRVKEVNAQRLRLAPDKNGVRLAELDEMSYRRHLWDHRPLTDFWRIQEAMRQIKRKYGKNAILKGMNFEEGATARERNRQVGGHRE